MDKPFLLVIEGKRSNQPSKTEITATEENTSIIEKYGKLKSILGLSPEVRTNPKSDSSVPIF